MATIEVVKSWMTRERKGLPILDKINHLSFQNLFLEKKTEKKTSELCE